jgi:DUF4097 and DUF4098 domain-containing protein YvlB
MHKTFQTPGPTSLYVEIGSGQVTIHATETTETEVHVEGRGADEATVEQRGEEIVVIGPSLRAGIFSLGSSLTVTVTLPRDSDVAAKLGSADLDIAGRLGSTRVKSGSGEVRVESLARDAVIQSGSGDVRVDGAEGDLRVKTGSGRVQVGRAAGSVVVATGSGRVSVDSTDGDASLKTGSGDVRVGSASDSLSVTSGSGDLEVGSISRGVLKARAASGDVRVGVPGGIPVWTDVSSVSGHVRSDLVGAGQPDEGQDYIEIRATTVSGDVTLTQL